MLYGRLLKDHCNPTHLVSIEMASPGQKTYPIISPMVQASIDDLVYVRDYSSCDPTSTCLSKSEVISRNAQSSNLGLPNLGVGCVQVGFAERDLPLCYVFHLAARAGPEDEGAGSGVTWKSGILIHLIGVRHPETTTPPIEPISRNVSTDSCGEGVSNG